MKIEKKRNKKQMHMFLQNKLKQIIFFKYENFSLFLSFTGTIKIIKIKINQRKSLYLLIIQSPESCQLPLSISLFFFSFIFIFISFTYILLIYLHVSTRKGNDAKKGYQSRYTIPPLIRLTMSVWDSETLFLFFFN